MKKFPLILTTAVVAALSACISNDLPYPWVFPNVGEVEVESVDAQGNPILSSAPVIDSAAHTITLNLTEYADIYSVPVEKVDFGEGTKCLDPDVFNQPLNLSSPLSFALQRYDHVVDWTIQAVQPITRYFTVGSQIGSSQIDVENHTITALVPTALPLTDVHVRTLKLGGAYAVMTPDIVGQTVDFTNPVKIDVTEFGRSQEWTITITQTDVSVDISSVDAWTNVAWVYAAAEEGKTNGFEYRSVDAEEWIVVPQDWITYDGGSFSCCLRGLESQATYTVRATSDDEHSVEIDFTTEANVQLPNSNFQNWWLDGKIWCPWIEGADAFWGTGNKGATTLGDSNTVPLENALSPTGYSGAKLETKYCGISILGKLAAGNLFAGDYVETVGTNGILSFGRPFEMRPTKLKARLKYTTAPITDVSKSNPDFKYMMGEPDTCIVWCSLGDWDEPYEIRTASSNRQLFERTDPGVIAYGQFQSGSSIDNYIDVEIPLEYVATDRRPKYILVTASASKYGDYFTGGRGATLWIDSYELLYDY